MTPREQALEIAGLDGAVEACDDGRPPRDLSRAWVALFVAAGGVPVEGAERALAMQIARWRRTTAGIYVRLDESTTRRLDDLARHRESTRTETARVLIKAALGGAP